MILFCFGKSWEGSKPISHSDVRDCGKGKSDPSETGENQNVEQERLPLAIIGRPNVGKSTLVNALLREDRQVVFDMPGTTRDSIDIPFSRNGVNYLLIDTAGIRRRQSQRNDRKVFGDKALDAMARSESQSWS